MEKQYGEYLLRKTSQDYNLIAADFSNKRRNPPQIIAQILSEQQVLPGEKILDLGCGNGRLYETLKDSSIEYFGIDNSEELIKIAKEKYLAANFQVANGLLLPFPDNYFDKIFSIAVLHQIPSLELRIGFLKEAKRVLKPGGLLVLTVWHLWQEKKARRLILRYTLLKLIGQSKLDFKDIFLPWKNQNGQALIQRYYHCFTRRELIKLVQVVNLEIKKIEYLKYSEGHYNICLIAQKQIIRLPL